MDEARYICMSHHELQGFAVSCSVLKCVAASHIWMRHVAYVLHVCCNGCCSVLQCVLQCVAVHDSDPPCPQMNKSCHIVVVSGQFQVVFSPCKCANVCVEGGGVRNGGI